MTRINSAFSYTSTAREVVEGRDLSGRTALVTGAASGIGLETARALAGAGAEVIIAVRDLQRGSLAREEITSSDPGAVLHVRELDLASLSSISALASELNTTFERLDILVNNAGVMATPFTHTADDFEMQFGTNHLGHFALFLGVEALLGAAPAARVVALSSIAHRISDVDFDDLNFTSRPYEKWASYGQSKTACSLFAVGVARNCGLDSISAFAVHPGGIMTGLQKFIPSEEMRAMGWVDEEGKVNELFKSVEQGASTTVWAAVASELDGSTGLYLENCQEAQPWSAEMPMMGVKDYALDVDHADRLWAVSRELIDAASTA